MEQFARNKKAYFDYLISDDLEAGIALVGSEIKAIRARQININGSYVKPFINSNGKPELYWLGSHFNFDGVEKDRSRKLLLSRAEIDRLFGKVSAKGLTILPLELYFRRGKAKLKIGLGTKKKAHDHREEIRRRDLNREVERDLSLRNR